MNRICWAMNNRLFFLFKWNLEMMAVMESRWKAWKATRWENDYGKLIRSEIPSRSNKNREGWRYPHQQGKLKRNQSKHFVTNHAHFINLGKYFPMTNWRSKRVIWISNMYSQLAIDAAMKKYLYFYVGLSQIVKLMCAVVTVRDRLTGIKRLMISKSHRRYVDNFRSASASYSSSSCLFCKFLIETVGWNMPH